MNLIIRPTGTGQPFTKYSKGLLTRMKIIYLIIFLQVNLHFYIPEFVVNSISLALMDLTKESEIIIGVNAKSHPYLDGLIP